MTMAKPEQTLRARYLNPNTGRFWSMDSYVGSFSDPLSLHKYSYARANSINRIDVSGNDDFSLGSLTATMGIGFGIGAASTIAANHALGRAQTVSSILMGGAYGALLAPFAVAIPAVGIGLGVGGLASSGLIAWQVFDDPNATPSQKVAATALVLGSIYGGAKATSYYKYMRGFEPDATVTINRAFISSITPKSSVGAIRSHLMEIAKAQGDSGNETWYQPELEMLNRFQSGATDAETMNWARHELAEIELTQQILEKNPGSYLEAQQVAHSRVIGHEMANGINPADRYSSDVKAKHSDQFNSNDD